MILAERMGGVRPGQWTFIYLPTVLEGYTAGGGALGQKARHVRPFVIAKKPLTC